MGTNEATLNINITMETLRKLLATGEEYHMYSEEWVKDFKRKKYFSEICNILPIYTKGKKNIISLVWT